MATRRFPRRRIQLNVAATKTLGHWTKDPGAATADELANKSLIREAIKRESLRGDGIRTLEGIRSLSRRSRRRSGV